MKNLLTAFLLVLVGLATVPTALAQAGAPDFPTAPAADAKPRETSASRANAANLAREQRRAAMSPEEAKRDEQMQILEARTGNTSFSRSTGPDRQLDGQKGGGFRVRKFKEQPGSAKQERGMTHPIGGVVTQGKPLVHEHKHKRFLFF